MKSFVFLPALLAAAAAAIAAEPSRTWTDAKGKKVVAELVRIEISVELRTADGKTVQVPIGKLSEADQKILRLRIANWIIAKDAPAAVAPATKTRSLEPWTNQRSTDELREGTVGMSKEGLLNWLGAPASQVDGGEEANLRYKNIARDSITGRQVDASITVHNGRVSTVITIANDGQPKQ